MSLDLKSTIEVLLRDPEGSRLRFPHEREIRTYQLQTWIYRPETAIVNLAGAICGAKYLGLFERKLTSQLLRKEKQNSVELKHFLSDRNYKELYDATVGEYGGWPKLVGDLQTIDFLHEVLGGRKVAETVCKMIDYRFRYLDHGGNNRQLANISHSEFYRWKMKPQLSGKIIRERWSRNRESAVYLYVSEGLHLRLSPNYHRMGYFFRKLSTDAADYSHIRRFFGVCAYVSQVLQGEDELSEDDSAIPGNVPRQQPKTAPLSEEELKLMSSYKDEWQKMRSS